VSRLLPLLVIVLVVNIVIFGLNPRNPRLVALGAGLVALLTAGSTLPNPFVSKVTATSQPIPTGPVATGIPKGAQPVPLAAVDPAILVPLLTSEIEKAPKNVPLRTQYADYCFDRKLDCAKEQYTTILELDPNNENAKNRLRLVK
jgi:hypothetical protein